MITEGIVSGDDVIMPVTLRKNGNTFNIDAGAEVKASVISKSKSTTLIQPVTLSSGASGADWANSLVIVSFSSSDTANITKFGDATLEIQVNQENLKETFFSNIRLIKGTIA